MAQTKLRKALIISQEKFEIPGTANRIGNEHDIKQFESVLALYGFAIRIFKDKKKLEVSKILDSFSLEDHSNVGCIMVIVLTHGNSGGKLLARDKEFYTKDVWGPFRDCEELKDVPKIFIFQACRGSNQERTFSSNSPTEESQQNWDTFQIVPVLPHTPGYLLVHSSIEDHVSIRNHATGTVFIQTLCNELAASYKKYEEVNFLTLLTEVNNQVTTSAVGEHGGQTSTFISFLQQPLNLKTNTETKISTPSEISFDASGGVFKTSYEDNGTRLLLILYTQMFETEAQKMKRVLNQQHFTIEPILVNDTGIIHRLSGSYNFENTGSLTVIVLAKIFEDSITEHCEKIYVTFSKAYIPLNDIWSQFTASRCHHLRGKPKIFFFCDFLNSTDSDEKNTMNSALNIESVNNHSDFLWAYCYGKKMFDQLTLALLSSREEITQWLTSAMSAAEESPSITDSKISYFESTLRLQFYFRSIAQQKTEEEMLPHIVVAKIGDSLKDPVASSSKATDTSSVKAFLERSNSQTTKEQKMTEPLRALTLVSCENDKIILHEEVLKKVLESEEARNRPIAVISIAGALCSGKSFFLSFVLRYLKSKGDPNWVWSHIARFEEFDWKPNIEGVMSGITIWPEVFVVNEVAIVLVDTQGLFDITKDTKEDKYIMVLSTLFSSFQILNHQENLNEADLDKFEYFAKYGMELEHAKKNTKAFQSLMFLIRDWKYVSRYPYGLEGGIPYLKTFLKLLEPSDAAVAEESPQEEWVNEVRNVPQESWVEEEVEIIEPRTIVEQRHVPQIKALHSFSGQGMNMTKGEVMFLLDKTNFDWWHVRRTGGQDGFVPVDYVQEIEPKAISVQVRRPEKIKTTKKVKKIQMVKQLVPVRKVKKPVAPKRRRSVDENSVEKRQKEINATYQQHQEQAKSDINEELGSVRDALECFEKFECCLLPYPGNHVARHEEFKGDIKNIDQKFLDIMKNVVEHLIATVKPKEVLGMKANGEYLEQAMKHYVKCLNQGSLPEPKSLIRWQLDTLQKNAEKECMKIYMDGIREVTDEKLLSNAEMDKLHKERVAAALQVFDNSPDVGFQDQIEVAKSMCFELIEASEVKSRIEERFKLQLEVLLKTSELECMMVYKDRMGEVFNEYVMNKSQMEELHNQHAVAALAAFDKIPDYGYQEKIETAKSECTKMMEECEYRSKMEERVKWYMSSLNNELEKRCMEIYNGKMTKRTEEKLLNNTEMEKLHQECATEALAVFDNLPNLEHRDHIIATKLECSKEINSSEYRAKIEQKVKSQLDTEQMNAEKEGTTSNDKGMEKAGIKENREMDTEQRMTAGSAAIKWLKKVLPFPK